MCAGESEREGKPANQSAAANPLNLPMPEPLPGSQAPARKSAFAAALQSALAGNQDTGPATDAASIDGTSGTTASKKEALTAKLASGEAPWDMISLRAAINSAQPGKFGHLFSA